MKIAKEGVGSQAPKKDLVKQESPIDKHKTGQGEATVDLHIAELVDNIAGLSSHDMFKIQMDYFRKMLDSAIAADYTKVTFIHGVGNGVLKNAIIEELKKYKNTENRMASIAKFGVGAIDVVIKDRS
jgi:dsDNA-specific endonuclease/ATPase MutS2